MIKVFQSVPSVIDPICHYCSKARKRWEIHTMPGNVNICSYCREWHKKAIQDFAQNKHPECDECHFKFEIPENFQAEPDKESRRCFLVPKDGSYGVLCDVCVKDYIPKRRDLVRGTEFAKKQGLI